jgi:glycosyltransferase involved in cell wall biosynthesis
MLSKELSVEIFDLTHLPSPDTWRKVKRFDPDIVHYIPGASPFSFFFTRVLSSFAGRRTKTITFSALNPCPGRSFGIYYALSCLGMRFIPLMKTNLVLAQSEHAERLYTELGCDVKYMVYSGVDVDKFHPVSSSERAILRIKHGIDPELFVVLHIGTVRKWRNVGDLIDVQKRDTQVVLVGRSTTKNEKDVEQVIRKHGGIVINGYDAKIEEFYGLADCYVFPTTTLVGSIDVPLTVLEAMAHNLPVISTRFGGLPRIFDQGKGFYYAGAANFGKTVQEVKEGHVNIQTRKLVLPYSWDNVARSLTTIYEELLGA